MANLDIDWWHQQRSDSNHGNQRKRTHTPPLLACQYLGLVLMKWVG